ncbi:putative polyketide synthase protein [Eutypa lata UCREL1]|uniref:Putative polyketide synthase protein n=1 Tax=Eutypa lata (strain UCR-EL1) TaxID=1287681 RepID=M7SFQ5_EUTLA|nr:putative polyketide synthase protein [Eutypa lata UCREL1]
MDSASRTSPSMTDADSSSDDGLKGPIPVAICGIATRLPGSISLIEQLWDFLVNKGDACARIPAQRYATHGPEGNAALAAEFHGDDSRGTTSTGAPHWKAHGYMLDHIDLSAFDSSFFSMARAELAIVDPQQRLLLELTRECFENAGETRWRGEDVGVYIGSFGEDWNDIQYHDRQDLHLHKLTGAKVETMFNAGVLSKGASSRSFDAGADGYARGEAVNIIYVKRLDDAIRDGNPIRAVIRATASDCDGKTLGLTKPSSEAHEALIRASYNAAGLEDQMGRTGFFECQATGTSSGDPEEAKAVANIFCDKGGLYIGSVKSPLNVVVSVFPQMRCRGRKTAMSVPPLYKRLEIGKRGSLKSLQWIERPLLDDLTGEEVYIDIRAVGMNFKDTVVAMGIINGPTGAGDGFGVECSGVGRAVGPDVTDLSVGDRVMAITQDTYATMTRTAASRSIKIPDDLSFEEVAGMPCVSPTVIHGIVNLARLEKGQTILIHSACGGVGLAAIYICRMIGVNKIYATVGSPDKVQYLTDTFGLPRSHIFSSRDASFLPGIMRETGNRGVDVVLNSLSGELLHASWKCVAEFGSMVEIGKRDFLGQGRLDMESFEGNRAFFGIEMWPIITKQPDRIRKLAEQFMGKLVVRIPEDVSMITAKPARQGFSFRAEVSYLLVGGLGGLGRSIAMWMVENWAKHLIFLSRGGGKKQKEVALVKALEVSTCTVDVVTGSVTEMDDVVRTVNQARAPIAGAIQLSVVLRDHLFMDMPFEAWEAVTAPKIQGTWNLHTVLARQPLDFFVLFSSFAGLI